MQLFQPVELSKPLFPGVRSLSNSESGDLVLLGGDNGLAGLYSVSQNKIVQELEVGSGTVTDVIWAGARAIVSTSSGVIKIFEDGAEISSFRGHRGKVAALALHPSGDILASVGTDKSYVLYDLASYTQATQVYTDAGRHRTRNCQALGSLLMSYQHLLGLASIQMAIYSLLEARTARLKFSMSRQAPMLQISMVTALSRLWPFRRTGHGWPLSLETQPVFRSGISENHRRSKSLT